MARCTGGGISEDAHEESPRLRSTGSGDGLSSFHAAVPFACDEGSQLNVRPMGIVFVITGSNPALVVPAVEGRILGVPQIHLDELEEQARVPNQPPNFCWVGRSESLFQLERGRRLATRKE